MNAKRNATPMAYVVEDQATIRELVSLYLQRLGFDVETFESGELVKQKLGETGSPPELVITDLHLGGISGIEVMQIVKKMRASAPVILMSGSPGGRLFEGRSNEEWTPPTHLLEKPFTWSEFTAMVWKACGYGSGNASSADSSAAGLNAP